MKIIIQSEDYLPNSGGIANHVHHLALCLAKKNHEVTIFTTDKAAPSMRNYWVWKTRESIRDGINLIEIPIVYSPRNCLKKWQINRRFSRRIAELAASGKCDVVHYHFLDFDYIVMKFLLGRTPIVFTNHSSQFLQLFEDPSSHDYLRQRLDLADAVIAPSNELKEKTIALGYDANRCHYIANGVDVNKFYPDRELREKKRKEWGISSDQVVILCARDPFQKNGILYFCEALKFLEKNENIVVLFAGLEAPNNHEIHNLYKRELWASLANLSSRARVIFLGRVDQHEMADYYRLADISVIPSLREATSITCLESMASGLAIVASRVGGMPELITEHEEGLLVEPKNVNLLAQALGELIKNQILRAALGQHALEKVKQKYTIEQFSAKTEKVYQEAIKHYDLKLKNKTLREKERLADQRKIG